MSHSSQHFVLTDDGELKAGVKDSFCVGGESDSVYLFSCGEASQQWELSKVKLMFSLESYTFIHYCQLLVFAEEFSTM